MKKKNITVIFVILFIGLLLAIIAFLLFSRYHISKKDTLFAPAQVQKDVYYCPMHPSFISDKPGDCPICGMKLVKKEDAHIGNAGRAKPERKILYYRNPMNPEATSPVPLKDTMGMDYVPVYGEENGSQGSGIYISSEKQQLIGVKKEKVEKKGLIHQILTVGKVAYDPVLYIAQEEYLQALKTKEALRLSSITGQAKSLLGAAERKLLLLGMGKEQIEELAKENKPQGNLYLPTEENTVWVYMTIYEYEIGLIKEGLSVEVDAVAFPGEVFKGKIIAITPVLNPETRSLQVRTEIQNPGHKLKPQMFVNAKINVDLGEKLAVGESAVIDTGVRKIVYVVKQDDNFEQREVILGQKALGYFEVLEGLKDGDIVVTSGNFLVDSESKLKGTSQDSLSEH